MYTSLLPPPPPPPPHTHTGIFSVINFIDREHLFCTSPSLLQSIADPSTFCIIAGVVFYYSLVQITLWWFFHIAALFWAFRFPLHFRSFQKLKRIKYVHIVCVVLGVVVPVLPVVVTIGVNEREGTRNGFGFGMTNFPPILCAGLDSNASFYSLVLPITLMAEVGMTLLVFTFWDVRKVRTHAYVCTYLSHVVYTHTYILGWYTCTHIHTYVHVSIVHTHMYVCCGSHR